MSVFQFSSRYQFFGIPVGIFSSRFGICCRFFKISRNRFGIFGISLCVKAPGAELRILKFYFRVNPQFLTEDSCQRVRRWQKLSTDHSPLKRRLAHWIRRSAHPKPHEVPVDRMFSCIATIILCGSVADWLGRWT